MLIKRGEIFYVSKEKTVDSEQEAGRPAIIVSNNIGNEHSPVVEVVYLTAQDKNPLPTHVRINTTGIESTALCEQITTVAKSRLGSFVGVCTPQEMKDIDAAIGISLALTTDAKPISSAASICPKNDRIQFDYQGREYTLSSQQVITLMELYELHKRTLEESVFGGGQR